MSGNHIADQADRERDDRDRCPGCRRHMSQATWCDENREICDRGCGSFSAECVHARERLYCSHCEIAVDID